LRRVQPRDGGVSCKPQLSANCRVLCNAHSHSCPAAAIVTVVSEAQKTVLVTGGAGFIGSHTVCELVSAGFRPVIVDNFCNSGKQVIERLVAITGRELPVYAIDCGDTRAMVDVLEREGPVFGIIHFAAHKAVGVSVQRPAEYYANNVGSLSAILLAMERTGGTRLVFSSSCTVYGQPEQLPVTEQSPCLPAQSPYGRTKQICEDLLADVHASGAQVASVILRYFNPVGAHPSGLIGELPLGKPENLVPFITQTAVGIRDQLTVFGNDYPTADGTCVRDYIHVVDLAQAHVAALRWLEGKPLPHKSIFNLGTGVGVTVLQAIHAFERATGVKLRYQIGPRRIGDVVQVYADASLAERELGWRAKLGIEEAMRDAYRWQVSLKSNG
jgi:UDP-glucose 4-epimerase